MLCFLTVWQSPDLIAHLFDYLSIESGGCHRLQRSLNTLCVLANIKHSSAKFMDEFLVSCIMYKLMVTEKVYLQMFFGFVLFSTCHLDRCLTCMCESKRIVQTAIHTRTASILRSISEVYKYIDRHNAENGLFLTNFSYVQWGYNTVGWHWMSKTKITM